MMLLAMAILLVGSVTLSAQPIVIVHESVDQSFLQIDGAVQILYFSPAGQEFTPTQPFLVAVDVGLWGFNPQSGDDTITVIIRKGTIGAPVLATQSQVVLASFVGLAHFRLLTLLPVTPGDVYVLEVQATKPTHGWFDGQEGVGYPGGRAIQFGEPEGRTDFAFQTYYSESLRFPFLTRS